MNPLPTSPRLSVALVGLSLYGEDADILRGIHRFSRTAGNWIPETAAHDVRSFAFDHLNRSPQGIIGHVAEPELAHVLEKSGIPVINVSGVRPGDVPFPHVGIEHRRVGELAARHLIELGLRDLAIPFPPGFIPYDFLNQRLEGFLEELRRQGLPSPFCLRQQVETPEENLSITPDLAGDLELRFLRELPTPCGIFAPTDRMGLMINEDCLALGLRVPEEISIIGAGNLDILCELSHPGLSSIAGPMEEVGFQAARLLHQLMHGQSVPASTLLSGPLHVHSRQSTSQVMVEDALVREALVYIRDHVREGINVADVARHLPVTRRTLELRFKAVTGESLLDRIHRVRIQLASELLTDNTEPINAIALYCGYSSAEHMNRAFQRYLNKRPRDFRRPSQQKKEAD
jgi:LacI family transcriptional regulator